MLAEESYEGSRGGHCQSSQMGFDSQGIVALEDGQDCLGLDSLNDIYFNMKI